MTATGTSTLLERPVATTLGTWGTSSAVRIPKRVCERAGVSAGSRLTVQGGTDERGPFIVIRPDEGARHRSYGDAPYRSIEELFAGYDGVWQPEEFDWGADVGAEAVQ